MAAQEWRPERGGVGERIAAVRRRHARRRAAILREERGGACVFFGFVAMLASQHGFPWWPGEVVASGLVGLGLYLMHAGRKDDA